MIRLIYNKKTYRILNQYSFKKSNNEVSFNNITIDFTNKTIADIPFKYQKVEIKEITDENNIDNGEILFTGYVDDIKLSTMKNKEEERELTLTLLSPLKMATIRTSSLIGTYTIKESIKRVLQPLIDDGFNIKELNVVDSQITVNFVLEPIENCMNNICSKTNTFWYINEKREIFVNSIDILFGKSIKKVIDQDEKLSEIGLINIIPTIENIDYANIINFKNVRLIYKQLNNIENPEEEVGYPIVKVGKKVKKGDIIEFDNPIIVDEKTLRIVQNESPDYTSLYCIQLQIEKSGGSSVYYEIGIKFSDNKYEISDNISFSDDGGEEKELVLQRDSFFDNLIVGFKYNGEEDGTITYSYTVTGLRYTTMKFVYTQEIEKLKKIVSDSGQIEKTIDFNNKWTTLKQLIDYGRSLMVQNSNVINTVVLEFDKNPNLEIGDIIQIKASNYFVNGNFVVKDIEYTYINENNLYWKITLKNSDLISTYIDVFRPVQKEENQNKIDTIILSKFVEEKVKEVHTIEIDEDNFTLNFVL